MKKSLLVTLSFGLVAVLTATACGRTQKKSVNLRKTDKPTTNVVPPPPLSAPNTPSTPNAPSTGGNTTPSTSTPQVKVDQKIVDEIKMSYTLGSQSLGVYEILENQVEKDSVLLGLTQVINMYDGLIANSQASLANAAITQNEKDFQANQIANYQSIKAKASAAKTRVNNIKEFKTRVTVEPLSREIAVFNLDIYNEVFFAGFDDVSSVMEYASSAQQSGDLSRIMSTRMGLKDLSDFLESFASSKELEIKSLEAAKLLNSMIVPALDQRIAQLSSEISSLRNDSQYIKDAISHLDS